MSSRHPISSADAAWLRMDRATNLMVINALIAFDERPDWERLRARFVARIVERFPRFGCVARGGHWEPAATFAPADHFHHVALPAGVELRELISDLVTAPLDHDRPLWEVHQIDVPDAGGALLVRVHHAVGDGVSLARVLLSASDDGDPDGPGFGAGAEHSEGLLRAGLSLLAHPRRAIGDVGTLAKLLSPWGEGSRVLKGDGRVGHRVAWSRPVALWRVKRIARAYQVTVNDVLMAALAGALRARIVAGGSAPERLHALVPLNLRPLDAPLPADLGNRFGLVLADLPVELDAQIERLWEVNRRMDAIKRSDEGAITFAILEAMGRAPAGVESRLLEFFTAKASLVVTNVIGPPRPISLAGAPVASVLVWAPCAGDMRMTVSLFSYRGRVTAGFLADAGIVGDPQPLADAFRAELLALARRARRVALA